MKKLNNKQIEILKKLNRIIEHINIVQNWLEIGAGYTSSQDFNENNYKFEILFEMIIKENKVLYEYTDNFFVDLQEFL